MIAVEHTITNEGAERLIDDINAFLQFTEAQMAGDQPDPDQSAAQSYAIVRALREKITAALARQERAENERRFIDARRLRAPVRERSGLYSEN